MKQRSSFSFNDDDTDKGQKDIENNNFFKEILKQHSNDAIRPNLSSFSVEQLIEEEEEKKKSKESATDSDKDNEVKKKHQHKHKHEKAKENEAENEKQGKKKKHKKRVVTATNKSIIAYKVAEAMAYVHSKNIMHRNLSCNTVVLDKSMNPFIVDFGTSRSLPEDESLLLTVGVGTERAKAPELTSDTRYSYEIDAVSYGMMLYEILANEIAFGKLTQTDATSAILSGKRPEMPENTPKALADLISRCWPPNAKDRRTVIQLVNDIPHSKVMFPDSDETVVLNFYRSVCAKSSNIQCCIDFLEQICDEIDEIIMFKQEAVRILAILCGYILALKKSKIGSNPDDEDLKVITDINNLMTALSRLSICIKNITSPVWENHALNVSATGPIDDINEALDSLVVPLAQL